MEFNAHMYLNMRDTFIFINALYIYLYNTNRENIIFRLILLLYGK